ncbi:MAG: hypothetical protein JW966_02095 [Anaerolineae bacterium]|nr:hypothetical protein [Anaerolineae bacterium]
MTHWRPWIIVIGLLLMIGCYHMPWFSHTTAGFTMNGFDLAEWTSLHPAVRSSSPAMLTSFLLRVPQLAAAAALALTANQLRDPRSRWLIRAAAMLAALRLIPPTDFFTGASDDPNYRQMALLTAIGAAAVLGSMPLSRVSSRWQVGGLVVILFGGTAAGWWGLSRAHTLLGNFQIDVSIGVGIVGYSLVAVLTAGLALGIGWLRRRHPGLDAARQPVTTG